MKWRLLACAGFIAIVVIIAGSSAVPMVAKYAVLMFSGTALFLIANVVLDAYEELRDRPKPAVVPRAQVRRHG